jgi:hypothetical protein
MWLSLCRDALVNGWTVMEALVDDVNSAQVISVKVSK